MGKLKEFRLKSVSKKTDKPERERLIMAVIAECPICRKKQSVKKKEGNAYGSKSQSSNF